MRLDRCTAKRNSTCYGCLKKIEIGDKFIQVDLMVDLCKKCAIERVKKIQQMMKEMISFLK